MTSPFKPIDPLRVNVVIARRVLQTVDAGLVEGKGDPTPGQMCVEAAVCYAYGLPHGDDPPCVNSAVRAFKINLNDASWTSEAARGRGLREIAIAQLGSHRVETRDFIESLIKGTIQKILPLVLRATANFKGNESHRDNLLLAARECSREGTAGALKNAKAVLLAVKSERSIFDTRYLLANDAHNCARDAAGAIETALESQYNTAAHRLARSAMRASAVLAGARGKYDNTALILAAKLGVEALKAAKSPGCKYLYLTQKKPTTRKRSK